MYRGVEDKWYTTIFDKTDLPEVEKYTWSVMKEGPNLLRTTAYNFNVKRLHTHLMGKKSGLVIDHINRNPLDNRRSNLRHVTHRQNAWNVLKNHNVYYAKDRSKWRVEVWESGKKKSLGAYRTKKEALKIRLDWEKENNPLLFT